MKQLKSRPKTTGANLSSIYPYRDTPDGHLFILGILAYPRLNELTHIKDFSAAVRSERAKAFVEEDLLERKKVDELYFSTTKRKSIKTMNHLFQHRFPRRTKAALMALEIINKWEPSVNKAVDRYISVLSTIDEDEEERGNVYRIIWNESLPVLHLALAMFPFFNQRPFEAATGFYSTVLDSDALSNLLLSNEIFIEQQIRDENDIMIVSSWVPGILKIAEAWSSLLAQKIPSFDKSALHKI